MRRARVAEPPQDCGATALRMYDSFGVSAVERVGFAIDLTPPMTPVALAKIQQTCAEPVVNIRREPCCGGPGLPRDANRLLLVLMRGYIMPLARQPCWNCALGHMVLRTAGHAFSTCAW